MHAALVAVAVAIATFAGTMVDNFVAFTAQLAVTDPRRHDRAGSGQLVGVMVLIGMSAAIGSALGEIPIRWVGFLAIVPVLLAVHAWRSRSKQEQAVKRGFVTTMVVTIAFGGDNLAVWIPIFRAGGMARGVLTTGVFLLLDVALIYFARVIARRPRVVAFSQKYGSTATPFLYVILALVIVWQCQWF